MFFLAVEHDVSRLDVENVNWILMNLDVQPRSPISGVERTERERERKNHPCYSLRLNVSLISFLDVRRHFLTFLFLIRYNVEFSTLL